jgi:undecaprenyl-diphosphatase
MRIAQIAAVIFFACLVAAVVAGRTMVFDTAVRCGIHAWSSPRVTQAMRGITQLGAPWFLITAGLIGTAGITVRGEKWTGLFLAAAVLGGEALNQVLKLAFHRVRPAPFFGLPQPENYSFPSGHAMVSTCFYFALASVFVARGARASVVWTGAVLAALLIGFSRVYLGVHYPADVLGGFAAGIAWVASIWEWFRGRLKGPRNDLA